MVSEITPLIIITKLEQYDYTGATAVAVVMLVISFCYYWPSTVCNGGATAVTPKRLNRSFHDRHHSFTTRTLPDQSRT